MAAVFGASYIFGLLVLLTSIGNDAIGIGVAALLVAVGGAGKAYVDRKASRAAENRNDLLVELSESIRADIAGIRSDVSRVEVVFDQRLTSLEDAITAPPSAGR